MNRRGDDRIRLLFVISQLIQGGAERWLFEVAQALDARRFAVEVLTSRAVRTGRHHYLEPLREAGIPVHRRLPLANLAAVWAGTRTRRYQQAYRAIGVLTPAAVGRRFLRGYDLICPVQVENWYAVRQLVSPERAVVHLMANRVQYDHDVYALMRDGRHHRLVLFNEAQRRELEGVRHESMLWPLSMAFDDRPEIELPAEGPPRIGVFTRLSHQKPLEPMLYAYQALLRRRPDAELHVFGAGDPETFGRTLDLLGLRGLVRFRGHATDLAVTLRREGIGLCWMLSVDEVMGYASIEIGSLGVPVLFWNLGSASAEEVAARTGGVVEAPETVVDLVERTVGLLEEPAALRRAGARLRTHVLERHEITRNIGALGDYYASVVHAVRARA